jgi:hypothetical protein
VKESCTFIGRGRSRKYSCLNISSIYSLLPNCERVSISRSHRVQYNITKLIIVAFSLSRFCQLCFRKPIVSRVFYHVRFSWGVRKSRVVNGRPSFPGKARWMLAMVDSRFWLGNYYVWVGSVGTTLLLPDVEIRCEGLNDWRINITLLCQLYQTEVLG